MPGSGYRITSECHVFPMQGKHGGEFIAYFPLKFLVLKVNRAAADLLARLRTGDITLANRDDKEALDLFVGMKVVNGPADRHPRPARPKAPIPRRTMLLCSDRCNLCCVYCYGKAETVGDLMPFDVAKAAVDTIVENALSHRQTSIDVGFHGGGEPTLNWDLLVRAIDYARARCRRVGLKLSSTICTNGVLPEERAKWIARNISSITISIDGPPEVHDRHRPLAGGGPSFDRVARTIDILDSLRKPYAFRVTATRLSEGKLPEIYTFLASRFHPRTVCVEPLFVCGRCVTSRCEPPGAEGFARDMMDTFELSTKRRVSLQYSGGRVFYLDSRFCGAAGDNFFVTPRGDVTSCVEVSSKEDPRSDVFLYGAFNREAGRYDFDLERYRELTRLQVQEFDSCTDCFARWHCSGDCLAKAPDMSKLRTERNAYRCEINRAVTKHQLTLEVERRPGGKSGTGASREMRGEGHEIRERGS